MESARSHGTLFSHAFPVFSPVLRPGASQRAEFANSAKGAISLCLEVDELEAAIAELAALGCAFGEILAASHGREVYAYDPAGTRLILHEGS